MKKVILALALLVQTAFVFANDNKLADEKKQTITHTKTDAVKLFKQPALNTEVLKTVNSSDEVVVVRKFNNHWTIVTVNGEVGYMQSNALAKNKESKLAMVKPNQN